MKPNQKSCSICGKMFTPVRTTQICCSKECGKVNSRICSARQYKRPAEQKNICKICGKPVHHITYGVMKHLPRMHDECILDDAVKAFRAGKQITSAQFQRLYSRGYDMSEVRFIAANE